MPPIRVYLDSSVIGGYYDDEFKDETRMLWKLSRAGLYRLGTSIVTLEELENAPARVNQLFRQTFRTRDSVIDESPSARVLAQCYISNDVVTKKSFADARHVAVCSVSGIQYLVSWNFKHMVNLTREAGFNGVNLLRGYPTIRILSPRELVYGKEEEI